MAKKVVKKKAAKPVKKSAAKAAKPAKKVAPKAAAKKAAAKPAKKPAPPAKKAANGKAAKPAPKKVAESKGKKADAKPAKAAAKPTNSPKAKPIPEKAAKKGKLEVEETAPVEMLAEGGDDAGEEAPEEIVLTDAEGRRYCRVKDCDQLAAVEGYCRYHYLLYWKKIQIRKKILSEGKLERYVEELTARYPDKFLEMLRKDLRSEKEFLAAIQELEIDESAAENEFEDETQTYIDEVRGMAEPGAREEEDF
jgi:hypothetical protein